MQFVPRPNFFIVSINKKSQIEKKEKEGSLYVVIDSKNEGRNMQAGRIEAIGTNAADIFPQAKIGHTLILHWMVESKQKDNKFYEDEENNYYHVTATECNGRPNEAYAVWDGKKIIPNPEYIFLETTNKPNQGLTPDEYIDAATKKSKGGIFLFDQWEETRADKEQKMAKLNKELESLLKTKMSNELKVGIQEKEAELAKISNDINKQYVEFYTVAAVNPFFNEEIEYSFGHSLNKGDRIGLLNIAAQTTVTFMGTEYIAALSKHVQVTEKWAKTSISKFKELA